MRRLDRCYRNKDREGGDCFDIEDIRLGCVKKRDR